ncbi:MAG: hybrid sensor histidine kinase/response regulator [Lyngbya sp. HA4199-MV5]|jgi:chemotaxis family two-component system sensor histidine kinase/response regulator PixL|nr:hybrid sensor histidine kinase/response regulator [Lyngbya sp. HA4199-MV5]
MTINSDIRDHAYQFFTEEAPELLQILEVGLLTLKQRNTATVHNLMRAAHSLKGGAASVGLDAIATLAHRLENILKALYSDALEIDTALENDLLRAYDCLRLPLMEQITTGAFNPEALAIADPIFTHIENRCGEALLQTETYLPSSAELGVDMVTSIFEVDVAQGLERLAAMLDRPHKYEVAGELRAQIEVFIGFGELLNLPEFKTIAETAQQALNAHPDRALEITELTLIDLERSRQAVLAGDRTKGLEPSAALVALALSAMTPPSFIDASVTDVSTVSVSNISIADPYMPKVNIPKSSTLDLDYLEVDTAVPLAEVEATNQLSEVEATDQLKVVMPQLESLFGLFSDTAIAETAMEPTAVEPDELMETSVLPIFEPFAIDPEDALEKPDVAITEPLDTTIDDQTIAADMDAIAMNAADMDTAAMGVDAMDTPLAEVIDAEWVATQNVDEQPFIKPGSLVTAALGQPGALQLSQTHHQSVRRSNQVVTPFRQLERGTPNLTVRVDSDRLERMSNLVGELTINRNGLSLQNEQLQSVLRELLRRFSRFEDMVSHLRESLDQMLVAPERQHSAQGSNSPLKPTPAFIENGGGSLAGSQPISTTNDGSFSSAAGFDSLEMDSYGVLHAQLQEILENFVQLDESVDDVTLYARQSDRLLDQQRHMLSGLGNELTQARMIPLGEVLNRFPRVLRDLSTTYHKPVSLKLTGTSLLVDRAILEKLYDPLLHLLRNAFDHGIEASSVRSQLGKPTDGQIEIRAYYKGNQTIIEIKDDGQGLNLDRIRSRAFELGWFSAEQLLTASPAQLFELIFEPGFSTAQQVSELSGRGIGLDVVRSQLQSMKGTVAVTSSPRQGATFTLRLPLTLTNTKLVICTVGSTTLALPVDSVEEIINPQPSQMRLSGDQQLLYWREQIIPAYRLADLLSYACPLPEAPISKSLSAVGTPKGTAPMLVLRQQEQMFAVEVDQLITEQELVIKSFGAVIAPPSYLYGCTSLGDGSLIPVIDSSALLSFEREQKAAESAFTGGSQRFPGIHGLPSSRKPAPMIATIQTTTILVVDDAVTLRRTLALSLERAGYRVLQARDGQEAIDQCQRSAVDLVICDIEMPNMNGFEFLSYRRQDPQIVKIPIMMLTSRSNEKHRWLAMQLGAAAYFTKPYLEQEFLAAIKTNLESRMA